MRTFLLLIIILFTTTVSAQKKVVLKNGLHHAKLKPGKLIGVTTKGETFHYTNWKNVCSGCDVPSCVDSLKQLSRQNDTIRYSSAVCADSLCIDNLWVLDSVRKDYIVLSQTIEHDSAYRFDTVPYAQWQRYERKLKNQSWFIRSWIPATDGSSNGYFVVAIPEVFITRRVPIDSIASFTFPKTDNCSSFGLGVPLLAAACIIGGPVAAVQGGQFDWAPLIVGEAVGGFLIWVMYDNIQDHRVKTYDTATWKIKTR
jgi:hypothetical protein